MSGAVRAADFDPVATARHIRVLAAEIPGPYAPVDPADPDTILRDRGVVVDWAAVQERVGGYQPELYAIARRQILEGLAPRRRRVRP
jgi:hypothetical protein